jgi:hypothetical protein
MRLTRLIKDHLRRIRPVRELLDARVWANTPPDYRSPHLAVWGQTPVFQSDPVFMAAYRRGIHSGHKFAGSNTENMDIRIEWSVHVACWAAWHARHLAGDFVECGVNTGILSLAICDFIDFNRIDKDFFLFDTFCGIPESQMSDSERDERLADNAKFYDDCYEVVRVNFAPYARARLVRGIVPDSLTSVAIDRVCYLSLDMNIAKPEIEALEFFWDRLSPGAPVLLDDFGFTKYQAQKQAMDSFAQRHGLRILHLPTGQGLLIKP